MRSLLLAIGAFMCVLANAQQRSYTLDDIYGGKIYRSSTLDNFKWKPDGKSFSFTKSGPGGRDELYEHNCLTGKETLVIGADKLRAPLSKLPVQISDYQWAANGKYVLVSSTIAARKLKTGGSFYIFDLEEDRFTRTVEASTSQENVYLSPDGGKAAFVRDNNLWIYDIENDKSTQVTSDGNATVLNGKFDWVYEEEFEINIGFEWAPDSRSIAFWRLDQGPIPILSITKFDSLYPYSYNLHYPKAGMKNSIVSIGIYNLASQKTVWADLGQETDIYIPRIKFTHNPSLLAIQRLNRAQQRLDLLLVNTTTGNSSVILSEESKTWIDIYDDLTFLNDSSSFLWSSRKDNYKHLYLYTMQGKEIRQITRGSWEVDKLLGLDETKGIVYYSSNERGILYNDVYRINLNSSGKLRLTEEQGWHKVSVSPSCAYFQDEYSNINQPEQVTLHSSDGRLLSKLASISNAINRDYDFGECRFIRFSTSDGIELQAMMTMPPGFDSSKKYPVLFYNYSGPGSQVVKDKWDKFRLWHNMMAQQGYIIFMLDNRGTGGRGKQFEDLAYKQLGVFDAGDMIEGARYAGALPYVDKNRIGIWGWSYGGYCAAMSLMKGSEYFKTAVSVAPVSDWLLYDDVYTERYMSLPKYNEDGYKAASLLNYVSLLKGRLLLVHGTADDNVHFQNSALLVKRLIKEGIVFNALYYPDKEHSIIGFAERKHLFRSITDFLLREL